MLACFLPTVAKYIDLLCARQLISHGTHPVVHMYSVEIKEASTRWEPIKWREQLENIKLMRASRDAPVDTIGAAALPKSSLPHVREIL